MLRFFLIISIFIYSFCIDAMSHPVEAILHQQMMKTLDENFEARKTGIEDTYNPIRDIFSDLLNEILKTKSGKLLVSSILKELKRPSTIEETDLSRDKVKTMVVLGENRWAYNTSTNTLKIPTEIKVLNFAVIKDGIVQVEKIDPRVALFHELLHWYHDLADIVRYLNSDVILDDNDDQNLISVWSHSLFPSFMSTLQTKIIKETIFKSFAESDSVSLEEFSTIFGNGSFDFAQPRSSLSENMFRLELGLGVRILYADIPATNEERNGWLQTINTQIAQLNTGFQNAEINLQKANAGNRTARETAFKNAQQKQKELQNLIRDMQMLCDIRISGTVLVDRQVEENLK